MKNPARPSRAHPQTPSRARREGSCSLWDTLDPQPWLCSPSLEGQGSSEGPVLPSRPAPAPLHGAGMVSSDSAATFNLRGSRHVRSRAVGAGCSQASCGIFPFALPGSAGSQTAASSPECFAGGGGPMASSGKGPKPGPRGALGPRCKALGVCHGCWRPAGFIGGLLRWAGSYNRVPCTSANLDWKCWV